MTMTKLLLTEFQRLTLRYVLVVLKKSVYMDKNGQKQSIVGGLSEDEYHAIDDLSEKLRPEEERKEAEA